VILTGSAAFRPPSARIHQGGDRRQEVRAPVEIKIDGKERTMKPILKIAAMILVLSNLTHFAQAQTTEKKSLTIDGAKRVIAAAVAYAKKNNAPGGVIAVVDEGGNLMALERLDGTFAAGANISIGKARTAVLFKRPTKAFEDIIKNGRTAMVALPDAYFTPLQGGVPITVDGQIVGGVGVSGASSAQQDEELAMAGANVFAGDMKMSDTMPMKAAPVLFFDKTQVSTSFSKGAVLLDGMNRNYMVHTSRRDQPGLAEIHTPRHRHHLCDGRHCNLCNWRHSRRSERDRPERDSRFAYRGWRDTSVIEG
jgi:glc operon protein GlcG